MSSYDHEFTDQRLDSEIQAKIHSMGIRVSEFTSLGICRFYDKGSCKESDVTFKPRSVRSQKTD
jgi:hypothetical protein